MLTTNFHLIVRLKITGAISLLPLHAFMELAHPTLPLILVAFLTCKVSTEILNSSVCIVSITVQT